MSGRFDEFRVIIGNGHPELGQLICQRMGVQPADTTIVSFPNENIYVKVSASIREKDVFIIQSTSKPLNDRIMELLVIIDACKRASAGRITAVLPYYPYGRNDEKDMPREPITARLMADIIQTAGAHHVVTLDLHAGQIQGFFSTPMDEMSALPMLARYFQEKRWDNAVVVSLDLEFAKRARNFAEFLGVPLAIVEKRRKGVGSSGRVYNVIGEVQGRRCILIDDEIATGNSVLAVTELLLERGAQEVYAGCVHPVFAQDAVERLRNSPLVEVVTTDSLPIAPEQRWPGLKIISVSALLAEIIQRIHSGVSLDPLSDWQQRGGFLTGQ